MTKESDHDLLIEIRSDLKNLLKAYGDHVKEDKEEFEQIDERVNFLENRYWLGVGVIIAIEIVIGIAIKMS